ncbi:hypothetical protein HU200_042288 [Digitaria exilis]|uniref:Protein EARLY FLOWERING 4 domain-containing protein n=1 Tax=Digitaria exilis TaxID=1010633 RepID=A0A835BB17_9POAL|nr:hypothetical protein HU200_042288 [Digitaria exilis]
MAPQVKGWHMSKSRRRSRLFWSELETQHREQRAGMAEEEPRPQPWWLRIDHGSSSANSNTDSSETGSSMEEDGGSISVEVEPYAARVRANGGAGSSGGGAAGRGGVRLPQVVQEKFGEAKGILEHNRTLIQEISQNKEADDAAALARNVALIRELNNNIANAVDLYGSLSGRLARVVAAKKAADAAKKASDRGGPSRPRSTGAGQ